MIFIADQNKIARHKAELHIPELSNIWVSPDEFELQDFLILLKNIGEESLKHGRIYSQYFVDGIKDKMIELDICPECGEELSNKTEKEPHRELDYGSFHEDFSKKYCESCSWEEEN